MLTCNPDLMPALPGFRAFPLDGALLLFHPRTGTHVRVATAATRGLERVAPRVVMFGVTNACNLRCAFCSRDVGRPSLWTVASAAATLRDLAAAGTLEVAFGGGEPLAFAGFADLVDELVATTSLALHVTTNGILLPALWPRLAGKLGIVRLSVYEDLRWRDAATVLTSSGQRWGANLLVDDAALDALPERLAALAALGATDVSILTHVGALDRQLGPRAARRLADMLGDAPLPVRISVCAGNRVPVPRLFTGDCGAGVDFVSVTPDQQLQSCSFKHGGWPARNAADILAAWREQRAELLRPSPRAGCARTLPVAGEVPPPVAVWQAFAGNNSGECIAMARFESVPDAEAFVAELVPGWAPEKPYTEAWRALFAREQVGRPVAADGTLGEWSTCPLELVSIGRSVIASGYDAGDAFPELRALAWKRGAHVVPGGIHVHGGMAAVLAIRCANTADAKAVLARPTHPEARRWVHGDRVLATVPYKEAGPDGLSELRTWALTLAGDRPLAIELTFEPFIADDFIRVKQRVGATVPRLTRICASFWGPDENERASTLARSLGAQPTTVAGGTVMITDVGRPKRLAVLAYRHGASVVVTSGRTVMVSATLRSRVAPRRGKKAAPVDAAAIEAVVKRAGGSQDLVVSQSEYAPWVRVAVETDDPAQILTALAGHASTLELALNAGLADCDALAWTVRRVLADVDA